MSYVPKDLDIQSLVGSERSCTLTDVLKARYAAVDITNPKWQGRSDLHEHLDAFMLRALSVKLRPYELVGREGLEPPTAGLFCRCSFAEPSCLPVVGPMGVAPILSWLRARRADLLTLRTVVGRFCMRATEL